MLKPSVVSLFPSFSILVPHTSRTGSTYYRLITTARWILSPPAVHLTSVSPAAQMLPACPRWVLHPDWTASRVHDDSVPWRLRCILNSFEAVDGLLTGLHWSSLEMTWVSLWSAVTFRVHGSSVSCDGLLRVLKVPIVVLILFLVDDVRLCDRDFNPFGRRIINLFSTLSLINLFFLWNVGLGLLQSFPEVGQLGSALLSYPSSLLCSPSALPGAAAEWAAESQSCFTSLSSPAAGQVNTPNCDLKVTAISSSDQLVYMTSMAEGQIQELRDKSLK